MKKILILPIMLLPIIVFISCRIGDECVCSSAHTNFFINTYFKDIKFNYYSEFTPDHKYYDYYFDSDNPPKDNDIKISLESESVCHNTSVNSAEKHCHGEYAKKFGDINFSGYAATTFGFEGDNSPSPTFGAIVDTIESFDIISKQDYANYKKGEVINEGLEIRYCLPNLKKHKTNIIKSTLKEFNEKGSKVLMSSKVRILFKEYPKKTGKYKFEVKIKTNNKEIVGDWEVELKEKK